MRIFRQLSLFRLRLSTRSLPLRLRAKHRNCPSPFKRPSVRTSRWLMDLPPNHWHNCFPFFFAEIRLIDSLKAIARNERESQCDSFFCKANENIGKSLICLTFDRIWSIQIEFRFKKSIYFLYYQCSKRQKLTFAIGVAPSILEFTNQWQFQSYVSVCSNVYRTYRVEI